jgi:glycosyltransferase involved in cell wall biosynthesis
VLERIDAGKAVFQLGHDIAMGQFFESFEANMSSILVANILSIVIRLLFFLRSFHIRFLYRLSSPEILGPQVEFCDVKKCMKIGFLSESMGWSGGAQQLLWMAEALQKRGHNLTLIVQPSSDLLARASSLGVPVMPLRMRQDYDVPAAWRLAKIVRELRLDILHAQHSTAHAIGLMSLLWTPVPLFAVTRRVIFPIKRNLFSRLKYLSKRIGGYIAISEAVRQELRKAGIPDSRIVVIPSVVRYEPATSDDGKMIRREFSLPTDVPLVLMVSNYSDFKGHEYLIRAAVSVAKTVPEARFLIAGRDTEKLAPLVAELGLQDRVRIAGFRTDVPRLHAAANLFVMPSLQEAAGTALREAMMAELPAIGTRVGGIPESIQDGETGRLVPPADAEALAGAIVDLLRNPARAREMAQRGQRFIGDNFTLEPAAQRMEQFYATLLSHTALPSR